MCMCTCLHHTLSQLLTRSPGHELRSPDKRLFQNAREHALPPHPELQALADGLAQEDEMEHANDLLMVAVLPLAYALLLWLCDTVDERFASGAAPSGAAFNFMKSNA